MPVQYRLAASSSITSVAPPPMARIRASRRSIRLEGVAYVRVAGKETVSTLSLAYREAAGAIPLLRSMLTPAA